MLTKLFDFVKAHINDIILIIIISLMIMLAFAGGYITAKYQIKTPIKIIKDQNI